MIQEIKILYFIFLCAGGTILSAQKEDNIWLMGTLSELPQSQPRFGSTEIHFMDSTIQIISNNGRLTTFDRSNSSICDKQGNLLFYSDGISLPSKSGFCRREQKRIRR